MSDDNTDSGGFEVAGRCRACGTLLGAVSEEAYQRMMAGHVLDEHAQEAPDEVLEEAREALNTEGGAE